MDASPSSTFCCVQCRLLQAPSITCAECGAPTIAPVELVRELLAYRDMRFGRDRDWGLLTAFLAGSSLAMPLLAPLAVGSMIALGVHHVRGLRRRQAIVGVDVPVAAAPPGATTLFGIARKLRGTLPSLSDASPVLLEHAMIRDRRGSVLLRRSDSTPFLLELEDGGPVLITGIARVMTRSMLVHKVAVKRGDPRLGKMGVPSDLAVQGMLEIASIAEAGGLAVTGLVEDEAVAELAFHRDGGRIPVMRGRPGAPVLVQDRRLIAAGL